MNVLNAGSKQNLRILRKLKKYFYSMLRRLKFVYFYYLLFNFYMNICYNFCMNKYIYCKRSIGKSKMYYLIFGNFYKRWINIHLLLNTILYHLV